MSSSLHQRTHGTLRPPHSPSSLTTPRAAATTIAVGPEVATNLLDVESQLTGYTWPVPHARRGRRRWQTRVQALSPPRIVLDATGGSERAVMPLRVAIQHRPRPPHLPAAPPRHRPRPRTTTSPRPTHHSITCRPHFINKSQECPAPTRPAPSPRPGPPP